MKRLLAVVMTLVLLAGCGAAGASSAGESVEAAPSSESQVQEVPAQESEAAPPEEESQPVQESSDAGEQEGSQPAQALTWWQEALSPEKMVPGDGCGPTTRIYGYDDAGKISWSVLGLLSSDPQAAPNGSWTADLITRTAVEAEDIGQPVLSQYFFEIKQADDTKLTGKFFEKGIELTRSLPGEGYGDVVKLAIDPADCALIQERLQASRSNRNWDNAANPQKEPVYFSSWVTMMRSSRIQETTFTNREGETRTYTGDELLWYMFEDMMVRVTGPGTATDAQSLPDADMAHVVFNNDLEYWIYVNDENTLVVASDAGGMLYPSDKPALAFDDYALGELNPPTGKPVIYLYPTQPTDCTVTLDYDAFTYTYPAYNGGWQVTAYPDGRLVNKADGSEHYYLFWEGNERIQWDFDSGFVVAGRDTESFLREKLSYLGLTAREANDFITYWVPRMKDAPYNLITFAGEQYEELAPLTVTPQPDSVLRVHMVFRQLKEPVEIPAQELKPFKREGFTVVEWGATDAGYQS